MKTQVMTFKINKSYEHWEKNFDSHREIQAAAGMTPLYRGRSEDDPQKVCIVVRMADEEKAANFMEENKDAILESGAPGVSTNFGVMVDSKNEADSDQKQNEEWALVYTSVGPNSVESLRTSVEETISSLGIDNYAFYTLPIPRALTYLGG